MSENDPDYVCEMVGVLREAAERAGEWESFCYVVRDGRPGASSATGGMVPNDLTDAWLRSANTQAARAARAWLRELRNGGKPWAVFVVGSERRSGNFDAFALYEDQVGPEWEISPGTTDAVVKLAASKLSVSPAWPGSNDEPRPSES